MNEHGLGIREVGFGPVLVRKPVRRVEDVRVVREATTGRVVVAMPRLVERPKVVLLPRVWAVADPLESAHGDEAVAYPIHDDGAIVSAPPVPTHDDGAVVNGPPTAGVEWEQGEREQQGELAFYRKYTEAMLRRYVRLAMASGRVPSLLGRELFRGHVSSYRMTNFEDVVVFCFDMEKLLGRLAPTNQQLIKRIAMQQYKVGEVASMLRLPVRSCTRAYGQALDMLTKMLLEARMLEPLKSCQGGSSYKNGAFN